jgi:hypothetical protein
VCIYSEETKITPYTLHTLYTHEKDEDGAEPTAKKEEHCYYYTATGTTVAFGYKKGLVILVVVVGTDTNIAQQQ